jgi:hypothetical protein
MAAMTLRQTGSHLRSDRSSLRPNQRVMGVLLDLPSSIPRTSPFTALFGE